MGNSAVTTAERNAIHGTMKHYQSSFRIYVCRISLSFALAAGASAQTQAWIAQVGTGAYEDAVTSAPDGEGGVFLAGSTQGNLFGTSAGDHDIWVARYDSGGSLVWGDQFTGTGNNSVFAAAPDKLGGVYICGQAQGDLGGPNAGGSVNTSDVWLARYDPTGNRTWIRQFGVPESEQCYAASPDGKGGVFLGGTTYGSLFDTHSSGNSNELWVAQYDSAGVQVMGIQFGSPSGDLLRAIIPDGSGGFYLAGHSNGDVGGPNLGSDDAWVARYDETGNRTWIQQFGTPQADNTWALAQDGAGGFYIAGHTYGSLGGSYQGGLDAWLARFDGSGTQIWARQIATDSAEEATTLTADGLGGVFVSGFTVGHLGGNNSGSYDLWLAQYNAQGDQTYLEQFGGAGADDMKSASPDGAGGVFLCGRTFSDLSGTNAGVQDIWLAHYTDTKNQNYCHPAVPNSTGMSGVLTTYGNNDASENDLALRASQLPQNSFGIFLTSQTQGFQTVVLGSEGNLCLDGTIGRFREAGQVKNSGLEGAFAIQLDLSVFPQQAMTVAVTAGQTWNFQAWYRDRTPSNTTNFTDAMQVNFE